MKGKVAKGLIAFIVTAGTAVAAAQPTCQWLSEGSASTLLGGPAATTNAQFLPSGEGSCTFTLQQEHISYVLDILVSSAATNSCPAGSETLKGIGNEAVFCRTQLSESESRSILYSRVRKSLFEVSLTVNKAGPNRRPPLNTKEVVEKAAEQVAGNLF